MAKMVLQKSTTWRWNRKRLKVALLLAAGELTDAAIAAECKISRDTIAGWKRIPAFQDRIAEHVAEFRARMLAEGFADKARRVQALNAVALDVLRDLRDSNYESVVGVTADGLDISGFDERRVRQFRGLLDDIAKEMQDRSAATQATATASVAVKVYVDPRMENPLEADWHDAPPPRNRTNS